MRGVTRLVTRLSRFFISSNTAGTLFYKHGRRCVNAPRQHGVERRLIVAARRGASISTRNWTRTREKHRTANTNRPPRNAMKQILVVDKKNHRSLSRIFIHGAKFPNVSVR